MKLDASLLERYRTQPNKGNELRFNCPYCEDHYQRRGKLWVNSEKGQWHCFNCGRGGALTNRDFIRRAEDLYLRGEVFEAARTIKWETYPSIIASGKSYLKSHNIDPEIAWQFGVRSGKGKLAGRLVFPAKFRLEGTNQVVTKFRVAHASREGVNPKTLQDGERQMLLLTLHDDGSPEFPIWPGVGKSQQSWVHRTAVIVEGPADALRLICAARKDQKYILFLSIVCLFGKHLSETHCFDLVQRFANFYVLLDREKKAPSLSGERLAALKIQQMLDTIADGIVAPHKWTYEDKGARGGYAKDPAELNDGSAKQMLDYALQRTGG